MLFAFGIGHIEYHIRQFGLKMNGGIVIRNEIMQFELSIDKHFFVLVQIKLGIQKFNIGISLRHTLDIQRHVIRQERFGIHQIQVQFCLYIKTHVFGQLINKSRTRQMRIFRFSFKIIHFYKPIFFMVHIHFNVGNSLYIKQLMG